MISRFYDRKAIADAVKAARHRESVGGLWDQIGQLQFDFLVANGLRPEHKLLDIGCGSLRGGVKFVRYLQAGHYFGTDLNGSLLDAGYEIEIANEGLTGKLPRTNLREDSEFDFTPFAQLFDRALAQSLFTHLPFNHMRACLERLAPFVQPGGRFHMTFFEIPDHHPSHRPFGEWPGGGYTHGMSDPFHYRFADIAYAAAGLPWSCRCVGDWGHPRGQSMAELTRI